MSVSIRPATDADLDAVCAIEEIANPSPWSRDAFTAEMNRDISMVDVLVSDSGEVVGFAVHWVVAGEAHLLNVAVAQSHRRRGLGRRLVEHVVRCARERDGTYLMLEVREGNGPARRLYEALGFGLVARRERYYRDNHEAALVLGLVLD